MQFFRWSWWITGAVLAPAFMYVSVAQADAFSLKAASFDALEKWEESDHARSLIAFQKSCKAQSFKHLSDQQQRVFGNLSLWEHVCAQALKTAPEEATLFFETSFLPHTIVTTPKEKTKITGYYIPELQGSMHKTENFRYPVYAVPEDFERIQPYLTRSEIDKRGLSGKAEILLWVDNQVDLFFLHVQGSGNVRMQDGSLKQLRFAAKNGHPYTSIGGYMVQKGWLLLEDVSLFSIKAWLVDHPDYIQQVLWQNDSYIFFELTEAKTIRGGEGTALTPWHSLAVDTAYYPYGIPIYLALSLPEKNGTTYPLSRLLIAQDTGSAIKGIFRGDIYFGPGEEAEWYAGMLNASAKWVVLLPIRR